MCVCDYICMCIGMQNIFIHAMCVYLRRARKTQLQIIMKIKLLPKKKKLQQRLLTLPQSECTLKKKKFFFLLFQFSLHALVNFFFARIQFFVLTYYDQSFIFLVWKKDKESQSIQLSKSAQQNFQQGRTLPENDRSKTHSRKYQNFQ